MTAIRVRPATGADREAVLGLYRQVDDLHMHLVPHTFRRPDGPLRTEEWVAALIADAGSLLLVAEVGSEVAGLLEAVIRDTQPLSFLVQKRFATVQTLVTDDRFRRQGVGRALLHALREWAEAQGAAEIRLSVYEDNREATAFYEALGFAGVKRDLRLPLGD